MNTQETFEMFVQRVEQRGKLDGELHGQRQTVLRQLRRKFGALPDDVVTRVQTADAPLLEQLGDNFLFASSLEEVFGS